MFCQQDVYVGQGHYKHRLPKPPSGATHGRLGTRGPSDTLVRCTEFVVTELYKADVGGAPVRTAAGQRAAAPP